MKKVLSLMLVLVLASSVNFAQYFTNMQDAKNGKLPHNQEITISDYLDNEALPFHETPIINSTNAINSIFFSQDFEGDLSDLVIFDVDGDNRHWSPAQLSTGGNCAVSFSKEGVNALTPDNWLTVNNAIDLSHANSSTTLSFKRIGFDPSNVSEHFSVYLSTSGNTYADFTGPNGHVLVDDEVVIADGWQERSISLAAYTGNMVYIAFRHHNCTNMYALGIDDILIEHVPSAPDLVVSPAGFTAEYYAVPFEQATFIPQGNVENIGTDLNSAVNLDLAVTGGYTDAQAVTTPLANGANEDLTFASFTAASAGTATFTYTATLATDADPSNNTFAKDIEIGVELARDNGIAAGNIGVGTPDEEMGNIFTITTADTLTSVKWVMAGTAGDEVSIIIRNFTTEPTTEVGRSLPVTNDGSAEYEANMVGLVVLQPGTYFIGAIEGANNLGMEFTSTPYVTGTAWAHFNNIWNDLGSLGLEHTYHIRPQFNNVTPIANDLGMVTVNTVPTILPGNLNITGTIKNLSTINNLTSFDVVYTIDGGTASAVYNVTGQSIAPGENFDFTHNIPYEAVMGFHTIEITISNPNGNTDENPSDNVMSKELTVINEIFPKTVVYEEGTGTWCGWCVRGLVGLNTMAHNITDDTWIGVAVHNNDPMVVTEYDNSLGTFISGYPSGVMDRHPNDIDPGLASLQSNYNIRKLEIPLAKAVIDNGTFDPNTREMSIDIESFFALDIASADYNAAIIVVENAVTGTGSDWEQVNYYHSGNAGAMEDWDGFNYVGAGNPVPAADMVYNHVGRALLGGWSGEAGSIPSSVTYNTGYVHTYTHTLPADQNYDNINLVGIIVDNSNGQIINATEVHATDVLAIGINKVNNSNFSIFPNPTTGLVKVEGVEGAQVVVYNMISEVVYTEANASTTTTINLSSFNAGNYIVKVINNNEVSTQKIVLTK